MEIAEAEFDKHRYKNTAFRKKLLHFFSEKNGTRTIFLSCAFRWWGTYFVFRVQS